jgi:hypothetical protein
MMFRRIASFVLAAGPAVLGVACSDSPTTAPVNAAAISAEASHRSGYPGWNHTWNNGSNNAALVWCQNHPSVTVSGNIGPSGGTITVGNARLIIPAGAIQQTVHFTATQPAGPNSVVTFEPAGLQFKKPAGLQFDVSGCNVGNYTPDIVYLDDEGVIVERIDAVYSHYWHQVAAPVKHFSSYALAW